MSVTKLYEAIVSCKVNDEKDLKNLRTQLNKSTELLFKNIVQIDEMLNGLLDPKIQTMAYVFLLSIKANVTINPEAFIHQVRRVVSEGSTQQIRLVPGQFISVMRRFTGFFNEAKQPMLAVRTLRTAVSKLRPQSESLTPLHADFLQICISSKTYSAALPLLAEEIYTIAEPDVHGFSHKDLLRYFYYGGVIFTAVKQFGKALDFFKLVFTCPATALSQIMVDAYKKWCLVCLLTHGQIGSFPKYTSTVVQRHMKPLCQSYIEFDKAYGTNSTDEVHKIASQYATEFTKDKNFGLIKQCVQALYRKNIQRHTQTYLTLSLNNIADSVKVNSPKVAEKYVLRMIEEGEIFATVNQKDGMVSFSEDPEAYNTNTMLGLLDKKIQSTIGLAVKLRSVDEEIATTPEYIQKTMHDRGRLDFDDFDILNGRGAPSFPGPGSSKGRKTGGGKGRKGKM